MEPKDSLTHLKVPATCLYPEPAQSSPYTHIPLPEDPALILFSHPRLGLPSGLFPSGVFTKNLYTPLPSPIRATYTAHLILLDFITRTVMGEECRSWSFSLWSFLHSSVKKI
jgi:hypothetical protein